MKGKLLLSAFVFGASYRRDCHNGIYRYCSKRDQFGPVCGTRERMSDEKTKLQSSQSREVDMKKYEMACVLALFFLSILSMKSEAQEWKPGVSDDGDFLYAATVNEAGRILGQYCYFDTGSCLYIVSMGITCTPGDEYPALVNSDAGSAQIRLLCSEKYHDENILFVNSFDDIDRIVRDANRVGFAVPMENDDFKVVRFSLRGAARTIDLMRATAAKSMKGKPQNRSRPAEERF